MGDSSLAASGRRSRVAGAFAFIAWLILALTLPLSALTLNVFKVAGFPLGFWIAAQGALIGLAILSLLQIRRFPLHEADRSKSRPMALAAETISGAGLVGFTGTIAIMGQDGLAFPLGVSAGLAFLAIFIAPRLADENYRSLSGYFKQRFDSGVAQAVAVVVVMIAGILIVAAELKGAGYALSVISGLDLIIAVAVTAIAIAAIWLATARLAGLMSSAWLYPVVLVGLLAVISLLALKVTGFDLPYIGFGQALQQLDNAELNLLEQGLADAQFLNSMTSAFLQLNMLSYAGVVLGIACGLAVLPKVINRHVVGRTAGAAVRSTAYGLALLVLVLTALPALATYARLAVTQAVTAGISVSQLPQWTALPGIKVCAEGSGDVMARVTACATVPDHPGTLRLQDVALTADAYPFAGTLLGEYSLVLTGAFALIAIVAAIVSVRATLDANDDTSSTVQKSILAAGILAASTLLAILSGLDITTLFTAGLVVAGASLFPALALGLLWKRMTGAGAIISMLTGLIIAVSYLFGPHCFPDQFFALTGALSNSPTWMVEEIGALQQSLGEAADAQQRLQIESQIRDYQLSLANWWGVKPSGSAIFAIPAALLTGFAVSFVHSLFKTR